MYDPDLNASPINPLPWVVVLLAGAIAAIELLFQAGELGLVGGPEAIGWRLAALQRFAFSDRIFEWMWQNQSYLPEHMLRLFSYSFVHQNLMHSLMVCVFILALGKFVGELFNPFAVLVIFLTSAAIGALVYGMVFDSKTALFGGYPAVYGLIGAFTLIQFLGLRAQGENALPAFRLIGFFMAIQLLFKLFFGGTNEWLAELVGFVTGFLLSILLSPEGPARIKSWIDRARAR